MYRYHSFKWHSRYGLTDSSDTESDVDEHAGKLVYLPVTIANVQATALLDGGRSLNIMSQSMLDTIKQKDPIDLTPPQFSQMKVADNHHVNILGTIKTSVGSKFGTTTVMELQRELKHSLTQDWRWRPLLQFAGNIYHHYQLLCQRGSRRRRSRRRHCLGRMLGGRGLSTLTQSQWWGTAL